MVAAGKSLELYDDAAMAWANEGTEPVVVLSGAMVDYDNDPIRRFDEEPRFEDAFHHKVVKRVVIEGINWLDEPYKIIVRDRSGRLVDAREPSEAELHWLEAALPIPEEGVAFGPDAFLRTDVWELMLRWNGGICGPDATIDIGTDASAFRVNNTTRINCDAVGATQWLALTLKGDRVEAEEDRRSPAAPRRVAEVVSPLASCYPSHGSLDQDESRSRPFHAYAGQNGQVAGPSMPAREWGGRQHGPVTRHAGRRSPC